MINAQHTGNTGNLYYIIFILYKICLAITIFFFSYLMEKISVGALPSCSGVQ